MIIKNLAPALAAMMLFAAPHAAFAQQQRDDTSPVAFGENADTSDDDDEEAKPAAPRTYAPINYDPAVEPDNVWVLDLSNGQRIKARLQAEWAPAHVERIKTLTRAGSTMAWCSTA